LVLPEAGGLLTSAKMPIASSVRITKRRDRDGFIDKREYIQFLESKVELCRSIYRLLVAMCRNNPLNERLTFELVPFFQIHAKYIPEATHCIAQICARNETVLGRLAENLRIDFDFLRQTAIQEDRSRMIKFLINLYDGVSYDGAETAAAEHIEFRQHEKLTSKPVNLINYFMNLVWDETAPNKPDYIHFLAQVCTVNGQRGVSINQENIFKLFKKYNSVRKEIDYEKYFRKDGITLSKSEAEVRYVGALLDFFAQLSFDRNFLWKQELDLVFDENYLVSNVWKIEAGAALIEFPILRAHFCKLAMSLYINHDPLF
jgi:hypothetical protein